MRYLLTVFLLSGLVLTSCAGATKRISADDRARRLNLQKSKAKTLIESGAYRAAIEVLEPLSEEATADHQLFTMLGESYAGLGYFDKAVQNYESAIRLVYTDFLPHLKLATLLMDAGKTGRALTEFELAVRYGPKSATTQYNYGLALFKMGHKRRALEQWRVAFDMEPENPKYAEAVGMALDAVDDGNAVEYFEEASRLGAEGSGFHNNYGLALQRAGDYGRARIEFEAAVRESPVSEEYRFNLAAVHMLSGSYRHAVVVWDSLISRHGPRWSYLVYRGEALLQLEKFAEAIESVEPITADVNAGRIPDGSDRLDRTPPGLNDAFEILAMSYRGEKRADKAIDYILRALALEPEKVSHLNNYGVLLAESGRIEEAKAQWRKVLEIDAENAMAREYLSGFER